VKEMLSWKNIYRKIYNVKMGMNADFLPGFAQDRRAEKSHPIISGGRLRYAVLVVGF
jgi:hypothetical protein